jgi:hypothetical protein
VCFTSTSTNVFEDVLFLSLIIAFSNKWDLVIHTTPSGSSNPLSSPSVGYVVSLCKGDGIGFKHPSSVFRWGEVGERKVAGEERQVEQ